ncbi:zinc finger, CCHC-type containing protein [Tanacetum coccineum]
MIMLKLPSSTGIKSILNGGFRKFSVQSQMIVSTHMTFSSANSTEYLVSTVDGMMLLKELNSVEVRLLSTRFHVLAIILSFASTSGPSEVLSIRESHNLRDSNSLKGDENPIRTLGDYSKPSHEDIGDPNQHIEDFLKLVDSLDLDGDNRERTRLRLFQFSLRDQASNWLERLLAGSITTWEDLTTRFLAQFFPPGRTAKLCYNIMMF